MKNDLLSRKKMKNDRIEKTISWTIWKRLSKGWLKDWGIRMRVQSWSSFRLWLSS